MIIMGIDPSLSSTGYAVLDGLGKEAKILSSGSIKSTPKDGETDGRINKIFQEILNVALKECVDYIIIERPAFGANNGIRSTQDLAGLYYVILCDLSKMGYLTLPTMPSEWKSKVGVKGRGRKEQKENAIKLVKEIFDYETTSNDEADAICIALYGTMQEVEIDV